MFLLQLHHQIIIGMKNLKGNNNLIELNRSNKGSNVSNYGRTRMRRLRFRGSRTFGGTKVLFPLYKIGLDGKGWGSFFYNGLVIIWSIGLGLPWVKGFCLFLAPYISIKYFLRIPVRFCNEMFQKRNPEDRENVPFGEHFCVI